MNALAATLDGLQDHILQGDAAILPRVRGADASHRLRIYANAWRLRLVEVLGNDFPVTRDTLGEGAFEGFAAGYLRAHPSTQPSVRHVGSALADWLQAQPGAPPGLHELARFEWLQATVFDAEDAPTLDARDVALLPADAWPGLRLRLHAAARLLDTTRLAVVQGAPASAGIVSPACWLLWRGANGDVHWRVLDHDEAEALHALRSGAQFGEVCERLSLRHGDDGALRAASLLKRWLADGVLAAPSLHD